MMKLPPTVLHVLWRSREKSERSRLLGLRWWEGENCDHLLPEIAKQRLQQVRSEGLHATKSSRKTNSGKIALNLAPVLHSITETFYSAINHWLDRP